MARTLTLDADVEAKLEREAQRIGTAPEELANQVLRRELGTELPRRKFVAHARNLGARPDVNFDCAWKLLDEIDRAPAK